MGQVLLPFLGYLLLQVFVLIVGLNIVREEEIGASGVLKSWTFGQMLLFAVLQVLAVPMILARLSFDVLFWSYCGVAVVLFGFGIWRLIRGKTKIRISFRKLSPLALFLLMVVILIILWQAGNYLFGIHLDEDDARWLAEANDALVTGDMMTRNYNTGEYIGSFCNVNDVSSPWPMMFSICSRLLNVSTSVFSHTVYSPIQVILMYGVYWLIAGELFEKQEAKLTFLLSVAIINLFYAGTGYTQSAFALVRIWQGKATVAAVIIPLLMYLFVCINKRNKTEDWIMVMIAAYAVCLMSGMGISLSAIMIGVYGIYNIFAYQNWKRIIHWVAAMLPSVVFALIHIWIEG